MTLTDSTETNSKQDGHAPAVSVIIRTFERREMLGTAIESVLNQTFQDFEIIVIDDASNDGTAEFVRAIKDDRVSLIALDENQGGSITGNLGIKASKGEWVANLDSDDYWYEDKLRQQIEFAKTVDDRVSVIYTAAEVYDAESDTTVPGSPVRPKEGVLQALVSREMNINFSSVMMRKSYLDQIGGFDEAMPRGADKDMLIRLAQFTDIVGIDVPLACSVVNHGPHMSGNSARTVIYKELLVKKFREWPEVSDRVVSQEYTSLAIHYARLGRYGVSFKRHLQAILTAPTARKGWVGLALFVPTFLTLGRYSR